MRRETAAKLKLRPAAAQQLSRSSFNYLQMSQNVSAVTEVRCSCSFPAFIVATSGFNPGGSECRKELGYYND